jgi:two-component system sensor histidine kinase SenX3
MSRARLPSMPAKVRLPMFVVAATLLGLIALLGTLQYQWLGRISEAERERRRATLNAHATAFAQDFDRELTRAYLLFQFEAATDAEANTAARVAARYDRWAATARFPRMVRDFHVVQLENSHAPTLRRFNPGTRFLEPADWPAPMNQLRAQMEAARDVPTGPGSFVRTRAALLWEDIPALVVPMDLLILATIPHGSGLHVPGLMSYAVLTLDREYISREVFPALAQQHFSSAGDGADYQLAVLSGAPGEPVFRNTEGFSPVRDAKVDASVDLFQVRAQEFTAMASEIRRFSTLVTAPDAGRGQGGSSVRTMRPTGRQAATVSQFMIREGGPLSIIVQQNLGPQERAAIERSAAASGAAAALSGRTTVTPPAKWRLLVQHRSGSLEAAVDTTRRRNLLVSSTILAILGASVGLLILSTRRAQHLARQQMEFVAAVSHELRTPLAVIRSAGDNLADGVVRDDAQIRRYGDLVRNEGRRLTEMVEQILEFAGIRSGQRGFALRPVAIRPVIEDIVDASSSLIESAGIQIEYDLPATLPPVLGDEPALRRVFQNLIGNAIKYGVDGRWIGVRAVVRGRDVAVAVADRGMGISQPDQARIFEPFYRAPAVIAAQIQGAGLGLSLVKRIVESHGGRISVRSEPGKGSEFTVMLPAAAEEPARQPADAPAVAASAARQS